MKKGFYRDLGINSRGKQKKSQIVLTPYKTERMIKAIKNADATRNKVKNCFIQHYKH